MPRYPYPNTQPIGTLPWKRIRGRVNRLWQPEQAPHHAIIGLTGSGKSYLVTRGLLPLCQYDKVCIIDVKGDDPTLRGYGRPVRHIPPEVQRRVYRNDPRGQWYRLIVPDNTVTEQGWNQARDVVRRAFDLMYRERDWIIIVDELRTLTDPRMPNLRLAPYMERFWTKGRSKRICVVSMTQEPKWVPSAFYTQPSFTWISRVEDEAAHKRITEIGSSRSILPVIAGMRKRRFLYMDNEEDDRFYAITGLGGS